MANSQIDVAIGIDISDIVHTAAGTVSGDVRVTIKAGSNQHDAVVTLLSIIAAIESDRIELE